MNDQAGIAQRLSSESSVDSATIERMARFGALLLEANRRFNLTGAKTVESVCEHLLDSLTVIPYVCGSLIDVGSGSGLPAVVLGIATGVRVTLIESTTKKAVFLETMLDTLGVEGRIIPLRAELAARDPALREQFDCGTARAVSTAPTVAELLLPFVRIGGLAILQRGSLEADERNALVDASPMLGGEVEKEIMLSGERRIILVRKSAPTPSRFPRRTGVPEKRPLCFT
ncbi:MAG: 16S rRNA (guanine(527)-N(7))-methyltransferase RsmG [Candidatus Eremiobacteraeota bacterium]|nr:16S rRNA (guanine(527)-N(7))-methyltransferase RsmG [Candidatus Eremiobacteraeota bacterium]